METYLISLFSHPGINWLLGLLFKSLLILGFTAGLLALTRKYLSSAMAHLFWLGALLCTALLPVTDLAARYASGGILANGGFSVFTVSVGDMGQLAERSSGPGEALLWLYGMVALALLSRLLRSAVGLYRLHRRAVPLAEESIRGQFSRLVEDIGIKRRVQLRTCDAIRSPVSYGYPAATVLVPSQFHSWPEKVRDQIFIHELSHIRRRDWPLLIFSKILCSLLWLNPLIWLASKQLHEEAEQACDSTLAALGRDRVSYAENLLQLARSQKTAGLQAPLAQPMFGSHDLTARIDNILEGKIMSHVSNTAKASLVFIILAVAFFGGGVQLLAADDAAREQEYLPVNTVVPMYPTRAADEGIEGWVLYRFTLRVDGQIDPNSIELVDSEPAGVFEQSARNALVQFEFQPRIDDGLAVDVPGVQYLFRYELEDDGEPDFGRPPPARR